MDFGKIRNIRDDLVLSPSTPRLAVRYHPEFIYLGDLQYITGETRHAEQFIFLSPNGLGHVVRMLLVQFEGYLENKPGSYPHEGDHMLEINGEPYIYDIHFIQVSDFIEKNPLSGFAHAADYIRQRAYTLGGDMTYQRFTRIASPDGRHKFAISYLETNEGPLMNAVVLERNPAVATALRENAMHYFSVLTEEDLKDRQ